MGNLWPDDLEAEVFVFHSMPMLEDLFDMLLPGEQNQIDCNQHVKKLANIAAALRTIGLVGLWISGMSLHRVPLFRGMSLCIDSSSTTSLPLTSQVRDEVTRAWGRGEVCARPDDVVGAGKDVRAHPAG